MKFTVILFSGAALFLATLSSCDQATAPAMIDEPVQMSALVAASEAQLATAAACGARSTGWGSSYAYFGIRAGEKADDSTALEYNGLRGCCRTGNRKENIYRCFVMGSGLLMVLFPAQSRTM